MNVLDYIESEEFRDYIRDNIIEFKEFNGFKMVDPNFTIETLNIDPMDIVENLKKENPGIINNDAALGFGLLNIKFKRVLEEEIAKASFDVTSNSKLEDYLDCIKRLGFEVIYEKKYIREDEAHFSSIEDMQQYARENFYNIINDSIKISDTGSVSCNYNIEETEFVFFNKHNSFLIHCDTYGKNKINASNLYGVVEKNNKETPDHKLSFGKNYTQYTNCININLDMRELPSQKIETLLTMFKPVNNWLEFSPSLYSYLTHKKVKIGEEQSWADLAFLKIKEFPQEVNNKLFSHNVVITKEAEKVLSENLVDNKFSKYNDLLSNLSIKEYKEAKIKDVLLDIRYEGAPFKSFFPKSVIEKAQNNNLDINNLYNYGELFSYHINKKIEYSELKNKDFENAIDNFSKKEKELFIDNISKYMLKYDEIKNAFDYTKSSLNSSLKRKPKMH